MTLDFLAEPLLPIPQTPPLSGQRSFLPGVPTVRRCRTCNSILEREAVVCLACDPHSLFAKGFKMAKTKAATKSTKVTPSENFPAAPSLDVDLLLKRALIVNLNDEPLTILETLGKRSDGITSTEILDVLAEQWDGGPYDSDQDGGFCVIGGSVPKFWAGQTTPSGKPTLTGEALVQACRRIAELPDALSATARGRKQKTDTKSVSETDDDLIRRALSYGDAWKTFLRDGCTDAELHHEIRNRFRQAKVHGPRAYAVDAHIPAIWFDKTEPSGVPQWSDDDLVEKVRAVLGLPLPLEVPAIEEANESDDDLLLRSLDADEAPWTALRAAETVTDGELQDALKAVWKVRKVYDKVEGSPLRAFYARANPYPAIWMDMPAAVGQPTLATDQLRSAIRRVLGLEVPVVPATTSPDGVPQGELPIDKIRVVFNDREEFDEERLNELAASIKQFRVIEPIVVSPPDADGFYTLIAGERRLRAATKAEHTTIAAVVRAFDPTDTAVVRLTENLLREPLTPIEEAKAYRRLLDGGLSQRALGDKLGVSQPHVASRVGLLRLPDAIQS